MASAAREYGLFIPTARSGDRPPSTFKRLYKQRSRLFHGGKFAGAVTGLGMDERGFRAIYQLHKLLNRLVLAVLDYRNSYLRSPWDRLGDSCFSVPEDDG